MSILTQFPTNEETRRQKMLLRAFGEAFAKNREARSLDIPEANRAEWIDGFNCSYHFFDVPDVDYPAYPQYFAWGFLAGKEFIERFFNNEG